MPDRRRASCRSNCRRSSRGAVSEAPPVKQETSMNRIAPIADPVQASLECLRQTLPPGSRVIVFGSHARGSARADSDLDLLVIEPEVTDRFAEMIRLSSLLGHRLIPADVVVMSNAAFEAQCLQPNTLASRAAQEGLSHDFPA
jgi:predicted nucleotidyltransferase